eukprot:CAMPEP_0175074216 /NCGR_PEP_ID=MMETSP0052_2-20121109/21151_1 /TAXON_ID=51329 ORGANISM="Polytomella parva, Strain SAG 63-3" /NCGR_SAMPLE_ID=MMETSP0052_2 /ASSEMBLY_ACC=CAM_ASM_000194 /LENGTH=185 /DNA_ID=CAMNT_0016342425 /DNA_START=284 /DNA_END=837 /DNA_ORIENTATION=+
MYSPAPSGDFRLVVPPPDVTAMLSATNITQQFNFAVENNARKLLLLLAYDESATIKHAALQQVLCMLQEGQFCMAFQLPETFSLLVKAYVSNPNDPISRRLSALILQHLIVCHNLPFDDSLTQQIVGPALSFLSKDPSTVGSGIPRMTSAPPSGMRDPRSVHPHARITAQAATAMLLQSIAKQSR